MTKVKNEELKSVKGRLTHLSKLPIVLIQQKFAKFFILFFSVNLVQIVEGSFTTSNTRQK